MEMSSMTSSHGASVLTTLKSYSSTTTSSTESGQRIIRLWDTWIGMDTTADSTSVIARTSL